MAENSPVIQIAIATHKSYPMPDSPLYLPMQVGAALHPEVDLGMQKDNTGDNISNKNKSYCELTALYWMWKNSKADYKGLVHYRRLFGSAKLAKKISKDRFDRIASDDDIKFALEDSPAILPKLRHYYIETVYGHYSHTFDGSQLDVCRSVIKANCPDYLLIWDRFMQSKSAHICNMVVMRADLFDEYCSWMFPLLGEMELAIDSAEMSPFQARWPGRISERMLNVWVEKNGIPYSELPMVSPEPVNWFAKGKSFLFAKFLGQKYEKSF